jgi:hypothetical protein
MARRPFENVGDTTRRDTNVKRQPVGTQLARNHLAFEQAAGMNKGAMINLDDRAGNGEPQTK